MFCTAVDGAVDESDVDLYVDEPKVDEPKVDEPKVDEAKVDEPKVDEAKVDDPNVPKENKLVGKLYCETIPSIKDLEL